MWGGKVRFTQNKPIECAFLYLARKWRHCFYISLFAASMLNALCSLFTRRAKAFWPGVISSVRLRRLQLCRKHLCISGCKDGYHGNKCSETCSPSGQCRRCDQDSGLCSACYSNSNLTPPSCTGRSCFWHDPARLLFESSGFSVGFPLSFTGRRGLMEEKFKRKTRWKGDRGICDWQPKGGGDTMRFRITKKIIWLPRTFKSSKGYE